MAVTVTVIGVPAVAVPGAETAKWVAVEGLTVTVPEAPVIESVTVSVAVTVCVPAVFRVTPEVKAWMPLSLLVPEVKV